TPFGIMKMLEYTGVDLTGKEVVVVGRSNIVGKPVALMCLAQHATVTICHSRTRDLPGKVAQADVVIAAVGRPEMIKGAWIKKGAVVIDVGVNRVGEKKLVGDVEFEAAKERASAITPVPGGVGPMTITMLLYNTVEGAKRRANQ
ncbi:MAG: bifunctional 5,10-methylene-tetrahydrofolate dehydrogenase/5,10-methylene-tetrahydrofolate cyclohydrolase, partial [Desulfuromonadales bacterium]|nr:bifunctional 5,10-methylene-tetrahydrofolate dehydrogenase/5,10-methylene-tetrahydrofolate cyclohydrolase [Desulfuromonadales bacterium]